MTEDQVIIASIVSNTIAVMLLLLSWKREYFARAIFALIFVAASIVNWETAITNPDYYLTYDKYATVFYRNIIHGSFEDHITMDIIFIAGVQMLIGLAFLGRGKLVKFACIGAISFLLAIAPLGRGAAFPFSIIASWALWILYKKDFSKNIVNNKWMV